MSYTFNNQVSTNPVVGQIIDAKTQGYTPDQIVQTLSSSPQYKDAISQAQAGGYSSQEIIDYLSNLK